jgi:UDP-3-O-[3-hydroxymyristoyl] glucosamine N-acyltransferase
VTASLTAADLSRLVQGELVGDGALRLTGVGPLDRAGPTDVSFLAMPKYLGDFHASRAGVVFCAAEHRGAQPGPATRIIVAQPQRAMLAAVRALFPEPPRPTGIHPTAQVGDGVVLGAEVFLGPHVVVGERSRIGDRAVLMAGVVLMNDVTIGADVTMYPRVVCYPRTVVGERTILHAGVCLGADGFGYVRTAAGHEKIPQVGRCIIGDDVEIGANSCVDRGSVDDTVIGSGSKLDNLVQVGHNVRMGARCIAMGQAGIAGSTRIEDDVILAGQSGLTGHQTIGKGAIVAAKSVAIGNVAPGQTVSGHPARNHREYLRAIAALYQLSPHARDLIALVTRGESQAE